MSTFNRSYTKFSNKRMFYITIIFLIIFEYTFFISYIINGVINDLYASMVIGAGALILLFLRSIKNEKR